MMNCKCQIIHLVIKTHCLSSNYLAYKCTYLGVMPLVHVY